MSIRDDGFYLLNIVEALNDIIEYTSVEAEVFYAQKMRQAAVIRNFKILGEATQNLSEDLRYRYEDIDWEGMAGFRDILIHQDFGIDLSNVYDIARQEVPGILLKIQMLREYQKAQKVLSGIESAAHRSHEEI